MLAIQSASCLNPIIILNCVISLKCSSVGAAPHSSVSSYTHTHTYTARYWAPARTCCGCLCTRPHPMKRMYLSAETSVASSTEQQYSNRSTYDNISSRISSSSINTRYLNSNSNRSTSNNNSSNCSTYSNDSSSNISRTINNSNWNNNNKAITFIPTQLAPNDRVYSRDRWY